MDGRLVGGFRVLAAIASGASSPEEIAPRLELTTAGVATHVDALVAGGFVRRDGDRLALGERATELLDRLVGRTDLLSIVWPIVAEAEARLGARIEIDLPAVAGGPSERGAAAPFSLEEDGRGGRAVVARALDGHRQVACVLRMTVDEAAHDPLEILGKELAATAEAISARLPRPKDRGRKFTGD